MAQILIWIFGILMPSVLTALISGDYAQGLLVLRSTLQIMIPVLILYLINYLWLVPHFLFVNRFKVEMSRGSAAFVGAGVPDGPSPGSILSSR